MREDHIHGSAHAPRPRQRVGLGELDAPDPRYIDLGRISSAARRQLPLVALCSAVGMLLAVAFILGSIPQYRAVETVLLDEERADLLDEVSAAPSAAYSDSAVESEVEIIKSQALALSVVDMLNLTEDPAFMNPPTAAVDDAVSDAKGLARSLLEVISPAEPPAASPAEAGGANALESTPRLRAAAILRDGLEVRRVSRSFVMELSYTGYDPRRVTRIARAYGDAYVRFQREGNIEVAEGAGDWLRQRLEDLERQSIEAARAVQEFRREHGLVSVRGDLLSDQQLSEMTTQLIRAEAETAQMRARLEEFESLLAGGSESALSASTLLTDTPSDEILAELRNQYMTAAARRREVLRRWDEDHPEAVRLAGEMAAVEQDIMDELQRAAAAVRADYEVARSREQSLRSNLDATAGESSLGNAPIQRLRQLERTAETYNQLHADFLRRYELAAQQQTFPIAAVEIISRAEMPKSPVSPNRSAMLAMGLVLGGMFGAGLGALRELREQPLRTGSEVRERLGLPHFGFAPSGAVPVADGRTKDRVLHRTLRSIKFGLDAHARGKTGLIAGVGRTLPGNGSQTADLLAGFLAEQGASVLLVHAVDLRTTRGGEQTGADALQVDVPPGEPHRVGLGDLAAGAPDRSAAISQLLVPLLAKLRERYDYVIVDLPPLAEAVAAEIFAPHADAVVLEVRWGRETDRLVTGALEENPEFASRLSGIVLGQANLRRTRRYLDPGAYEARLMRSS